jgi:hypothetical protein
LGKTGSYCLLRLLIQYGAVAEDHSEALITAIGYEKTREFEYLVEQRASLSATYRTISVAKRVMDSGYQPIIDICLKYGAISDIDKS